MAGVISNLGQASAAEVAARKRLREWITAAASVMAATMRHHYVIYNQHCHCVTCVEARLLIERVKELPQ